MSESTRPTRSWCERGRTTGGSGCDLRSADYHDPTFFVEHSTDLTGVALEQDGDFRIDDELNPALRECASPVLLIRSTSNGTWLAAGIVSPGDD